MACPYSGKTVACGDMDCSSCSGQKWLNCKKCRHYSVGGDGCNPICDIRNCNPVPYNEICVVFAPNCHCCEHCYSEDNRYEWYWYYGCRLKKNSTQTGSGKNVNMDPVYVCECFKPSKKYLREAGVTKEGGVIR